MNNECFIVCPIGKKGSDTRKRADALYDLVIAPACEKFDISPVRVDKLDTSGLITNTIIRNLKNSKFVVVDLSDHNPNVFYELGIRHALNQDVILIKNEKDTIPFDIHTINIIDYSSLTEPTEVKRLSDSISRRFKNSIDGVAVEDLPYNSILGKDAKIESIFTENTNEILDQVKKLREYVLNNFSSDIEERTRINARYIEGEHNAFEALTKSTLTAKREIRSTRFFPSSVLGNQDYVKAIESRVLGTDGKAPLTKYYRIVALNNPSKLRDTLHDINAFQGKPYELHLTKVQNAFELVVIDSSEVFIHFYKDEKIIASTLQILEPTIVREFKIIYDKIIESTEKDYVFDCSKLEMESLSTSFSRAQEIFSEVFPESFSEKKSS